ncbi:MAG: peptidoglycan-binding domain-containing protein [Candidatus Saccharimonas sp.]
MPTKPTPKKSTKASNKTSRVIASTKKRSLSKMQWGLVSVIAVAVISVGAYLGVQYYQDTTTSASSCIGKTYKVNSTSTCVKYAQVLLNYKIGKDAPNIAKVSTDGVFGPKTLSAVKAFQKYWGLSADGVIGKNTWASLCSAQMGYTDSKGVSHGVWTSSAALSAARSAGCNVKNDVVR